MCFLLALHLRNDKALFADDRCGKRTAGLLLKERQDPVLSPTKINISSVSSQHWCQTHCSEREKSNQPLFEEDGDVLDDEEDGEEKHNSAWETLRSMKRHSHFKEDVWKTVQYDYLDFILQLISMHVCDYIFFCWFDSCQCYLSITEVSRLMIHTRAPSPRAPATDPKLCHCW